MSEKQERVPIDVNHPEQFLEHEFYLAISRDHLFEDIDARMQANAGILRRAKWAARDLVNRLRRREQVDFTDYDGSMVEVAERQPHSLKGYGWPDFNSVTFEDGTRVATTIPADEVFRSYIFVPVEAQATDGTGYRMRGTMRPYSLHDNTVGELEQKVDIHYNKVPQHKSPNGHLVCF